MPPAPRAFRRSAAAAAALALLGAAVAASAAAETTTTTDYAVDVQIAYHYEHRFAPPDGLGEVQAGFTVAATLPKVSFRDGVLTNAGPGRTAVSNVDSTAHLEQHTPEGTVSAECAGSTALPVVGVDAKDGGRAWPGADSKVIIKPFAVLPLLWDCVGPQAFPSGYLIPNFPDASGQGPLDVVFDLPAEATSMGKIIQIVNRDAPADQCPLRNPATTSCSVHMQGEVTFVRTGQHTDQVAPPTATPPATPPVDPNDTIELEPLVRNKAKLTSDGSKATFAFRCGAGCTLVAHAYPGGGGVRAAASARALATKRVTLAHGGTRTVTMRFGTAARRAIKRAGGVRLALSVTPRGGGKAVQRSVTLKLRRR